jgi:hypothetical protein
MNIISESVFFCRFEHGWYLLERTEHDHAWRFALFLWLFLKHLATEMEVFVQIKIEI